jgi:DNA-binding beta-propeller fold protein YncE
VHGFIPEPNKGYISDGLDRAVTVFDRNTLKILKVIKYTGVEPDAIQYDPDTRRLFVVNGGASGDVTLIDHRVFAALGVRAGPLFPRIGCRDAPSHFI